MLFSLRWQQAPIFLFLLLVGIPAFSQSGFVKSGGQAIPGATVAATQGDQTFSTVTDSDGHYAFPLLGAGTWNITVEMFGFDTLKKDVDFASANGPVTFELTLKPSPVLQRLQQFATRRANGGGGPGGPPGNNGGGARSANGQPAGGANGQGGSFPSRNRTSNSDNAGLDQQLENELNGNSQNPAAPQNGAENGNESFLISGSLSPGMTQGAQADSGPDMRFIGGGPPGMPGAGGPNADMAQNGGLNPGGGFGPGGPGAPGGGGFGGGPGGGGGGFGGGGFGGRGGGGGGFGGRGGPGQRRPGQTAGATFGNRRRQQNQIHGQASFTLENSAVNAKPFSLNGLDIPQASYAQSRFSFILNGPLLKFKPINDTKTNFFITYFGTRARNPNLFVETVPTEAERMGDFSAATQSLGQTTVPVQIYNPSGGLDRAPFAGNQIPASMLDPTALTLLRFYPLPNEPTANNANNYQTSLTNVANTDNLGVRIQRNLTSKDRVFLNLQYQHRDGTTAQPFGYSDDTSGYGLNTQLQWTRNISQQAISTLGIRFNRNYTLITPYFSTIPNPGLNLPGASTNPLDYGPPTLTFTNFSSLSDSNPTLNRNQTFSPTEAISILKGLHSLQFGGGFTRADLDSRTDPNARGTFSFTGQATSLLNNGVTQTATGYDLADFLLGFPQSTSISYSEDTHYFIQDQFYLYAQDEWKAKPNLTLILGVRYDYFSPLREKYGHMSNLDVADDFASVAVVTPTIAGPYSGVFPAGLIDSDWNNFSPRVALAWKIPAKKSTLFRAGYGIYYNGQAYIPFGNLLANQSAAGAVSQSANTSLERMLTIANGFLVAQPGEITQTFAVGRNYRTPYAGTWNASIQRDLGGGMFVEVGYLGTKGTGLDVRIVPNQQPPGSVTRTTQLGNALAFTNDESVGNSAFESGHVRFVRRFNRGISVNAFYQYGKSIDDSSTFGGAGNTTAQNWLDISAERGLSSFDIRHQFTSSFVFQSPIGTPTSRIAADSKLGHALANWQLTGAITAQTGEPLTARALGNNAQLAQTGGTGSQRAEATGEGIDSSTGFFNLNAFTVPAAGTYGNAGRNTIPGPGLFNLNLAFARSFAVGERRRSVEFRVESNNVLNHVNYTGLYTVVNALNYGLPSSAGAMRTMDVVVRLRF